MKHLLVLLFSFLLLPARAQKPAFAIRHLSLPKELEFYDNQFSGLPVDKLPFRLTDMTPTGGNHFTAINYFFRGEADAVYRTPAADAQNTRLITQRGAFKNYCRLLDIERTSTGFTWRPLGEFPGQYRYYNWEGIAAYKNGYFILNDKFTPARPYRSTLLYLQQIP